MPDECKSCSGKGWYSYDKNHSKVCEVCCTHDEGFFVLSDLYANAGDLCCMNGCGFTKEQSDDR